jgi:hypothetical protein
MATPHTTITAAEIDAYQARIVNVLDELDSIRKNWPVGPVWSAIGTAHHTVVGVAQALHDLKLGNDRAVTVQS